MPFSPVDIGQRRGVSCFQEIEPLTAHDCEAEIPEQLLVMLLADAVEIDDLAVQIVQHFHLRRLLPEEPLCAACECLNIGRVLRKYFNDAVREAILPTYV